jgi:nucleoside-diphosphate-sugar epimerase
MVGVTLALLALLLLLLLLRCLFTLVSPRQAPISLLEDLSFYTAATALPPYAHIDGEHADSSSPARAQRRLRRGEPTVSTPLRVVVTGGAGFLGAAIARQLRQRGHQITVLDRCLPAARNRVHGATYAVVDLVWNDAHAGAAAAEQRVVGCCRSADAVVHAAGCVCLLDDPGRLHNAHVVATAHVIRCARLAGVRALVCTSSTSAVTSPFLRTPQLRVPCDLLLPRRGFPFASHYSRTKYEAERLAISAHRPPELAVTVLRLPGVYGLGDSRIVDPLLSGLMTHVPSGGEGCLIDFCYVENAAHAHCVAVEALLLRGTGAPGRGAAVGGRAFNVSSGSMYLLVCVYVTPVLVQQ